MSRRYVVATYDAVCTTLSRGRPMTIEEILADPILVHLVRKDLVSTLVLQESRAELIPAGRIFRAICITD